MVETFAGIPQREKTAFWALRESRNEKKLLFELCGNPATRKNCFLSFAGVPQRGKTTFGLCGSPAKPKKFFETLVGVPQMPPPLHLRHYFHRLLREDAVGLFVEKAADDDPYLICAGLDVSHTDHRKESTMFEAVERRLEI